MGDLLPPDDGRLTCHTICSLKRAPAWTDRIMYTTYSDSPETPEQSSITNALYTSIPSYTTSDHVRYMAPVILMHLSNTACFHSETCHLRPPPSTIHIRILHTTPAPTTLSLQSYPRPARNPQTLHWPHARPHHRVYLVVALHARRRFGHYGHRSFHSRIRNMELVQVEIGCG